MPKFKADLISAVFEPIEPDGSFPPEQLKTLHKLGAARKAILLAFPPKAGGTFLRSAIIKAIDGQLVRVIHALGGRDATPYLPTFVDYFTGGVTDKTLVTHVHMLALPANLYFLAAFRIRPIVMKRSIPDMLASYWDMLESDDNALREGLNCIIPENFRSLPRNAKADFLIDVLGPWYANFYAGWLGYAEASPGHVCVLEFAMLRAHPVAAVKLCLEAVAISVPQSRIELAVLDIWQRRATLRFNKGEEGRGGEYFRAVHLHRLARMLGHYPSLARHQRNLLATGHAQPEARRRVQ